jgi:hypothetical protein
LQEVVGAASDGEDLWVALDGNRPSMRNLGVRFWALRPAGATCVLGILR